MDVKLSCRDCRTTIPLTALKVSTLCTIYCDFYRYPNTQIRMCELSTFSQIRSHIMQKANRLTGISLIKNHSNFWMHLCYKLYTQVWFFLIWIMLVWFGVHFNWETSELWKSYTKDVQLRLF